MSSFNKKTRSPGYKPGEHWVECMRTGRVVRASDIRKEWNGLLVAKEEYEDRHPQEFIRGIVDNPTAQGYVNQESGTLDIGLDYGEAITNVARSGSSKTGYDDSFNVLPSGTFNVNTL